MFIQLKSDIDIWLSIAVGRRVYDVGHRLKTGWIIIMEKMYSDLSRLLQEEGAAV